MLQNYSVALLQTTVGGTVEVYPCHTVFNLYIVTYAVCYSVHYEMHYVCVTLYVTLYVVVCIDRGLEYDDTAKGSLFHSLVSPQLVWNLSFILNIPALKCALKCKCMTLGLHRGIKTSPSPSVFRKLTFELQEAVMSSSPASLPHHLVYFTTCFSPYPRWAGLDASISPSEAHTHVGR